MEDPGSKDGRKGHEPLRLRILRRLRGSDESGSGTPRNDRARDLFASCPTSPRSRKSICRARENDDGPLQKMKSDDSIPSDSSSAKRQGSKNQADDSSRALNLLWGTEDGARQKRQLFSSLLNIENFD